MRATIGNIPISVMNTRQTLDFLWSQSALNRQLLIFFMNANNYNISQKDSVYNSYLHEADLVLNDGIGIELGAKLFGVRLKEDMNGSDFSPVFLQEVRDRGLKVFLLGASPNVAATAADVLSRQIPGLIFSGTQNGYFKDSDEVIREINQSGTDVLLVGMGVPLQEKWITEQSHKIEARIIIAIGAYLDFAAGNVKRAPKWIRNLRMEWLFRLVMEPRRLWKRYLIGNIMFFIYILKNRLRFH